MSSYVMYKHQLFCRLQQLGKRYFIVFGYIGDAHWDNL